MLTANSTEFAMMLQTTPYLEPSSDSGSSNTDNITTDTTPTFSGMCVNGATVVLVVDGVPNTSAAICVGGVYSMTYDTALLEGDHDITLMQTVAGTAFPDSAPLAVTIDETAPVLSASMDTSSGIDTPTVDFSAVETGSGIERFEVEYLADNNGVGVAGANTIDVLASTATDLVLDLDPDESVHTVIVRAYDAAGNLSTTTLIFPPLIDITAPTTISNSAINDTTFIVTSPAGNPLTNIASTLGTVNCDASGNGTGPFASPVSCTLTGIASGGTAAITAEEPATGATGQAEQAYVLDTTAPVIMITENTVAGPVMSDDFTVNITDSYPDTSSYEYGFSSDATCDATDTYGNTIVSGTPVTFNTEANNGSYICVIATDLAGNTTYSPASANPLNIDITPPTFIITAPANGSSTNDTTPTVT